MKVLLLKLLLAALLSGCSHTKIHLVHQQLSKAKISSLVNAFEQENINVVVSTAVVPSEFPDVSLAMNPGYSDFALIEKIKQTLAIHSLSVVQEFRFAQGQHFYNGNNIGVYLKDSSNRVMPSYLRTQYCKYADATIQFSSNNTFTVEYEANSLDKVEKMEDAEQQLSTILGHYDFDGKKLSLFLENGTTQRFTYAKEEKETHLGPRQADTFKPLQLHQQSVLNCEFLIIYMN